MSVSFTLLSQYISTLPSSLSNFSKKPWSHVKVKDEKAKQKPFPSCFKKTNAATTGLKKKYIQNQILTKEKRVPDCSSFSLFQLLNRYYVCMVYCVNAVLPVPVKISENCMFTCQKARVVVGVEKNRMIFQEANILKKKILRFDDRFSLWNYLGIALE